MKGFSVTPTIITFSGPMSTTIIDKQNHKHFLKDYGKSPPQPIKLIQKLHYMILSEDVMTFIIIVGIFKMTFFLFSKSET